MMKAIDEGSIPGLVSCMGNVLESVTVPMHPEIGQIKALMTDNGALGSLMSGSGPTVFGVFDDIKTAQKAYKEVKASQLARQVFLTRTKNWNG